MKVAHFRTPFLSFSETFIYEPLKHMSRVRPVVFTRKVENEDLFPFADLVDYSAPRLSPRWVADNFSKRVLGNPEAWLKGELKKREIRALHAHFGEEAYALLDLKADLGLPLVATFYGYDMSELPRRPGWAEKYRRLFAEGDLFLVEGGHMRRSLVKLGCPEDKVRIQRISVDLEKARFRRPEFRGKTRFLFCGRFVEKKGLIVALKAVRLMREKGLKDFELGVIGGGPLEKGLKDHVRENGLEENVIFHGKTTHSEFHRALADADILVAPSLTAPDGDSEGGAPTVLLEAQATGLPVVSTRHADIPEIVTEGKSALLSDEGDAEGLARNMIFMMERPEVWESFGREGRRLVESQFDVRKTVRGLEEAYLSLAGREKIACPS